MRRIYLDYAATTPVDEAVMAEMKPYFSDIYGNPSSTHGAGEEAQGGIIAARRAVARLLNSEPSEIAFTSGASEGNNAVVRSFAGTLSAKRIGEKPHLIITAIEHDCILESAKAAESAGEAELTILPADREGFINPEDVVSAIRPNTALVSVMYANNETGVIQRIPRIGRMIREVNAKRGNKVYFHTDAVQAANYLDCDVDYLGVDLMTLSSHKIYGPKGVGALFIKNGVPFDPFIKGGEQEFHKRAGTHNVSGIVGMGRAVLEVIKRRGEIPSIIALRDKLIRGILDSIPGAQLAGRWDARIPNNANILFSDCYGGDILKKLSAAGVYVSTGSACAAKSADPSHVLTVMGFSADEARSAIRFSLGRRTTGEDIDYVLSILPGIVESLRQKERRIPPADAPRNFPVAASPAWYPEVTVAKSGYQTVMDSRLPVQPVRYEGVSAPTATPRSEVTSTRMEGPAVNASFSKTSSSDARVSETPEIKFYGDEEIDRGGLPADLGCEKNRKVGEEEG